MGSGDSSVEKNMQSLIDVYTASTRGQGGSLEKPRHLLELNALIPCDIVI